MSAPKLYLKSLSLHNFATFSNEEIHFSPNFNCIVGETGSGKSLIMDALELIFGARVDKNCIRKGADFATVEAIFISDDMLVKNYLEEIDHPYSGNEIVVKRIIYKKDTSKAFLNFQSCPLSTLRTFSKRYIDLVGQFENQKLLSPEYQLVLLDHYSSLSSVLDEYNKVYTDLTKFQNEICKLMRTKEESSIKEDFLLYQINEIDQLSPTPQEEELLIQKKDTILKVQHSQKKINDVLQIASEGEEFNVISALDQIIKNSLGFADDQQMEKLHSCKLTIEDFCYSLSKNLSDSINDQDLDEIIDRLDQYQKLKRKYNCSTEELLNISQSYKQELESYQKIDTLVSSLQEKVKKLQDQAHHLANQMTKIRQKNAKDLSQKLTASIQSLKMLGASIHFNILPTQDLGPRGKDRVELLAETNPGEGPHPLKKIASGGELSRTLLALRQILSSKDSISVFLFDEIDTGVGGETALAVGNALDSVSAGGQVIAITHLPQIAKFSDLIINVTKNVNLKDKVTNSRVEVIDKDKNNFIKEMTIF